MESQTESMDDAKLVPLSSAMLEEIRAWQQIGMQSVVNFYEKIHDHGDYQDENGEWKSYPSGEVGQVCKTCGKTIEDVFPKEANGDEAYEEPDDPEPNGDTDDEELEALPDA